MLGRIRKFSSSIFAKVFLFIVAIPFIFWGMGDLFRGGNQNTIVKIDEEKITVKEFIDYLEFYNAQTEELKKDKIEKVLSNFIGEKLIEREIKNFNIQISDSSLSKLIKNEKIFKKENEFSRIEYEKFLVSNSLDAITFERNLVNQIKREQFFNFVSGGITRSKFLVNMDYDQINQKRHVQIINLNETLKKNINFSENKIQKYFDENEKNYIYHYRSIKYLQINPENLTGSDEFGDLFFEKLDNIDDLIVEGKNINFISNKFNLNFVKELSFNKSGKNKNGENITNFPNKLIQNVFLINELDPTILATLENKYYIIELIKSENIQKDINDDLVKKDIITNLEKNEKRKLLSDLISKISANKFNKQNFDNFSKDKKIEIEEIVINNKDDERKIKKKLVEQIYSYPENKVMLATDVNFAEIYLVYVNKIEHVSIANKTKDYEKYSNLSKGRIINSVYNTYDAHLNKKYNVDINYKALESIKNYIQ